MYVKIFSSIFNGSLRGQSDELLVMLNLLCHADVTGVTDIHFQVISDETGLPIDRVRKAIQSLESPDLDSRSPDEEGRRITRLDEHRDWGWHIVNYEKYRKIRSAEEEREKVKQRVQRYREKRRCNALKRSVTDVTKCNPIVEEEEEEEEEEEKIKTYALNDEKKHRSTPPKISFSFEKGIFENISELFLLKWQSAFPAVDVQYQLEKMACWLLTHPQNRKSNYAKFINNWLSKAQDQAGPRPDTLEPQKKVYTEKEISDMRRWREKGFPKTYWQGLEETENGKQCNS